ncbi:MAG: deaminase domain-containing protein [Breznakibacter sp.]
MIHSKDLTLRSRFNDGRSIDIWQLWATDNLKKANGCYGIAPLAPVCLGDERTSCSSDDVAYLPAIYVQSLTDAADVKSVKTLANAALTFAGATGSINLLMDPSRLARALGAVELANLAADGVLANPLVRARLAQAENGKAFLEVWPYVNTGIDLTAVSTDILVNFVNSGRKAAAVLDELPANKVAGRIDEAEEVLRGRGLAKTGENWNGFSNIFKANADEVLEATNRIKEYRVTNNFKGGNYGYLEGFVNGNTIPDNNKFWRSVSSDVAENEIHIFDAINVKGSSSNEWLRITDSEYRMLNKLASDLGAVKGGKYPNITGELKIISENPYCASCSGVIQQFNEMFPNIKLILIDGAK